MSRDDFRTVIPRLIELEVQVEKLTSKTNTHDKLLMFLMAAHVTLSAALVASILALVFQLAGNGG